MADISDFFGKASIDTDHSVATTVTADRTSGATVLSCFDLSTFTEDTPVFFVTYTKTTDPVTGEVSITNTTSWKGLVNAGANTITNLTIAPGYVDDGNTEGQFVECIPTSYWVNSLIDGLFISIDPDGTLKVSDGGAIDDENGNEQIKFSTSASAVNEVTVANAATGNAPVISATGDDTNIDLKLSGKGTGIVEVAMGAEVDSDDAVGTLTSTTFISTITTLGALPAVTVTVPSSGKALVMITALIGNDNSGGTEARSEITYAVSGATTVSANTVSNTKSIIVRETGSNPTTQSGVWLHTGLTPGSTTFTMNARVQSGTGTVQDPSLVVIPIG